MRYGDMDHCRWLKGTMIFLQPWWFLGRCRLIISASHTMFRIY